MLECVRAMKKSVEEEENSKVDRQDYLEVVEKFQALRQQTLQFRDKQ